MLKKRAALLKGSVALTVVSDEEIGGAYGTKHLLQHCGNPSPRKSDVVVNGEPGGLQSVRSGEKGTLHLTFTVATEGGNGAYTHRSYGVVVYASALIVTLKAEIERIDVEIPPYVREYLRSDEVRRVADDTMGAGAAANLLKATLNIGIIQGGVKVDAMPSACVFEADIHLPVGLTAKTVCAFLDEMLISWPGVSYCVQEAASNPSSLSTLHHPFSNCIADDAQSVTGCGPVSLVGLDGTDCNFYRYQHVPAFVFGPSPSGMGAVGEAVLIDEYISVIKTHALAVFRYLWDGKEPMNSGLNPDLGAHALGHLGS
ncbi:hypothetical protein G6011_11483 [Alternaria panax]|uniref:Peptidase M20 dimerisation domain-containing protein n=1 Tax=Alternaria panax TaxID=48097 RepID=A0AAD4IDY9_9PLEO|nr:hypothetical protein G6011_11483 [Alternaria panax]